MSEINSQGEEVKTMKEVFKEIEKIDFKEEITKSKEVEKPRIHLPVNGKLVSTFAEEIADVLKETQTLFYRPASKDILEVTTIKEKETEEEYIGFSTLKAERFITLAENYFIPQEEVRTKNGSYINQKSMNSSLANTLLSSPQLQDKLPKIKRLLTVPIPILYKNTLTFPKKGYDERFYSWTPMDAPTIDNAMSLEQAKQIIDNLFREFCFQEKQDYMNAIAGLLTPFLKGLFPTFSTRSPVFFYMANRERAGKDYCADITGIVYEGHAIQEPPICNGEHGGNNNEELRKKVLSAMIAGRKRLHFANNRGYIDNAVFEGIITTEKYSDRALGRNETLTFDNEFDFSLSGNVGVGFTADLANRSRFIRLFLDIEDANARKFNNPNLHAWVKQNRGLILSALYSLVNNWVITGKKEGTVPFASYPEWAKICGGIMEAAGYDSPCRTDKETLAVGGDVETNDMKTLFELCYERWPEQWVKKQDIRHLVMTNEDSIFGYLDFNKKADQTKFGTKLTKFIGRMLSDILLKVKDSNVRAARQELMFTKDKVITNKPTIFGNLSNLGNQSSTETIGLYNSREGLAGYQPYHGCQTTEFEKLQEHYKKEGLI